MIRVEKTVFISYRRTNVHFALAISQNLTHHGFDVFFDYQGIASGDFSQVILENIRARAHFLVLLTPSALERCEDSGDWLRREIEEALDTRRNIVPLMLDSFDFGAPAIASKLTGKLALLKCYNGMTAPVEYFDAAMTKLRDKFLNVPLNAVLHPASPLAQQAAKFQQAATADAAPVQPQELTAEEWFERGFKADEPDEAIRCYTEVIRIHPNSHTAYSNRGAARGKKGDFDGAILDCTEAIRIWPDYATGYNNRGVARYNKNDFDGAITDYSEALRFNPNLAEAYGNRGEARLSTGDFDGAITDCSEAIRLQPDDADFYHDRGKALKAKGDIKAARRDFAKAKRLRKSDHVS